MLHRPSHVNHGALAARRLIPPLSATLTSSVLVAADTIAILGAGYLSYVLLTERAGPLAEACVLFVWLVSMMLMHFAGLYRFQAASQPLRYVVPVAVALATAFLFLLAAGFSIKVSDTFSRLWMTSFAGGSLTFVLLGRAAVSASFSGLIGNKLLRRNLAIVGDGEQTVRLVQRLHADRLHPVSISGVFVDGPQHLAAGLSPRLADHRFGGDLEALVQEARSGAIDDVVIALPWSEDERVMAIVSRLRELPVNVYLASDLIGFRTEFRSPPGHFGALPVVQLVGRPMSGWDSVIKSLEDYVLASILVVVFAPLLLAIAAAIKLDSRGPVLFRQKRLGFNNQVIDVYKFRSMHAEAGHAEAGGAARTRQATQNDPRVTRVGGVLRRWSLDELPQLFNVLNGTMSLVGPRPHALDHNEDFARQIRGYFARHRVKPGITGLAQVRGYRGATDTPEKLEGRVRNDIFYVDNWSLSFDVQILLRTFVICLVGKNAY
jgi:putative colanic acid biosysnthesis UDP-glucose lipid carrier transferase